jgi:hypothetical protein
MRRWWGISLVGRSGGAPGPGAKILEDPIANLSFARFLIALPAFQMTNDGTGECSKFLNLEV